MDNLEQLIVNIMTNGARPPPGKPARASHEPARTKKKKSEDIASTLGDDASWREIERGRHWEIPILLEHP
jgi:hypothetical protein